MRGFSFYRFPQGGLYMLTNYSAAELRKLSGRLSDIWPECRMTYEYADGNLRA